MADFHFMYPQWLWLLVLLPLLWLWVWRRRDRESEWDNIVDAQLAPFVLTGHARKAPWRGPALVTLLSILAILAIAGPAWEKREVPAFRKQDALMVALDLSASMYAPDMTPNRLDAARFKLLDLLATRKDGQTGLVVFAGDAFAVSPLTEDTETIAAQVKNLSPEIMPVQGSNVDLAIQRAVENLQQARQGNESGHILLLTDGAADVARARAAARKAVEAGYTVSLLGLGTEQGAPIPLNNGGFLQDSQGQTVIPRLDQGSLQSIAVAGQGVFSTLTVNDADLQRLQRHWALYQDSDELVAGDGRQVDDWFNQGIWLVLLLLPLSVLFFRRGWLGVGLLVVLLPPVDTVQAASWNDLWLNPDQQGQRALENGDAETASTLFEDQDWKAAAAYRAGDYAQAEALYAGSKTIQGQYNYGNALARQGKWQQALVAYEQVLAQKPDHEDARYNRDLVKAQLEKQQQNQQQQAQGQQNAQQQGQNNGPQQGGQQSADASGQSSDSQQDPQQANAESAAQQQGQDNEAQNRDGNDTEQTQVGEEQTLDAKTREQQQATEQWLRRIPDDPAGLWRRKFQYQYRQRGQQAQGGESW